MAQYYLLDDSGDPGMGGSESSSRHFVLTMVQLAERAPLPALSEIRQTLHLSPLFEFKYYKTTTSQKEIFFQATQPLLFRVRAVVIDKPRLEERFRHMSGHNLTVEFISRLTLRASELDIANDVLVIDGATLALLRAVRIWLSAECRRMGRVRPFRKIVSGDSKREDGLQLADMVAGAIRRYVMGLETGYFAMFAGKVLDLWEAPD